jgi:hypothetical protein
MRLGIHGSEHCLGQEGQRQSKHGDNQKWADGAGVSHELSSDKQSVQCPPWERDMNTVRASSNYINQLKSVGSEGWKTPTSKNLKN